MMQANPLAMLMASGEGLEKTFLGGSPKLHIKLVTRKTSAVCSGLNRPELLRRSYEKRRLAHTSNDLSNFDTETGRSGCVAPAIGVCKCVIGQSFSCFAFNFPSVRKFKQIAVKVKRIESLNDQCILLPWEFFPLGCSDGISSTNRACASASAASPDSSGSCKL